MTGNVFYFEWEPVLMAWIQQTFGAFGKALASLFTFFGEEKALVVIMCICYFVLNKELGKSAARKLLSVGAYNAEIKNLVCRPRPYFVHKEVACLKAVDPKSDVYNVAAQGFSCPSGHSSNSAAMYGSIAAGTKYKGLKVAAYVIILLVGVSRFFLGVHYPTDVLLGWALGFICVYGIALLEKHVHNKWLLYAVVIVPALPGLFFCRTNDYYTSLGMIVGFALADLFETKYVRFTTTKRPIRAVVRVALAIGIYLGLNELLKLPFDKAFLVSATTPAFLVRTARYMIVVFVVTGLYPMLFGFVDRFRIRFINPDGNESFSEWFKAKRGSFKNFMSLHCVIRPKRFAKKRPKLLIIIGILLVAGIAVFFFAGPKRVVIFEEGVGKKTVWTGGDTVRDAVAASGEYYDWNGRKLTDYDRLHARDPKDKYLYIKIDGEYGDLSSEIKHWSVIEIKAPGQVIY